MKNKGFTLAEVLVTIAIIGVVAALTITSVVTKVSKMEYYSRFISAYSKINTAFNTYVTLNGELQNYITYSNYNNSFCRDFISNNLKIVRTCNSNNGECFAKINAYKELDGNPISQSGVNLINSREHYLLNDGVAIFSATSITALPGCPYASCYILIDTNGPKGPNQYGRDVFSFEAIPYTNTIQPNPAFAYIANDNGSCKLVSSSISRSESNWDCDPSKRNSGLSCSGRLLREKKMDY